MSENTHIEATRRWYRKITQGLQDLSSRSYTFPVVLAFLTLISFGLLLPLLGFYWDDWPFI